jgi:fructose-1,6-bisphosphatase
MQQKEAAQQSSAEWREKHAKYIKEYRENHKKRHREYMREYMRARRKG